MHKVHIWDALLLAGMKLEISYIQTFTIKYSNIRSLQYKLLIFFTFLILIVSIWKYIATVLNNAIDWSQMGVSIYCSHMYVKTPCDGKKNVFEYYVSLNKAFKTSTTSAS